LIFKGCIGLTVIIAAFVAVMVVAIVRSPGKKSGPDLDIQKQASVGRAIMGVKAIES